MTLPIYLAMTKAELGRCSTLPPHCAYMACHFSPYGTGLSDLPIELPKESLLIINDRIPVSGHDPKQILTDLTALLEECSVSAILLDLQRKNCEQTKDIVQAIVENLPLPTGVSEYYARDLQCPVFVGAPPLHKPLSEHLKPWTGRELWLDVAMIASRYTVRPSGCTQEECSCTTEPLPLQDQKLHCHYRIQKEPDAITFTLQRTGQDLQALIAESETLGVTKVIGLYQEYEQYKQWGVEHRQPHCLP